MRREGKVHRWCGFWKLSSETVFVFLKSMLNLAKTYFVIHFSTKRITAEVTITVPFFLD